MFRSRTLCGLWTIGVALLAVTPRALHGAVVVQVEPAGTVTLSGRVTDRGGRPIAALTVELVGVATTSTNADGQYRIERVPQGTFRLMFRRIGFRPHVVELPLGGGSSATHDVVFELEPVRLAEVVVFAASRSPERLVDAPAAISVVAPERIRDLAPLGQTPLLVADLPGVHVRQSGAFDFNLNTRGFNFTNNRRVLVLVDGRDTSVPLLGNQEWADLAVLEDATRVEMLKGPGSALYGANAFGGVLSISTPAVRDAPGLRASVTAGEPGTIRADVREGFVSASHLWGVRVAGGALQGNSFDRSRTDSIAFREEYAAAGVPNAHAPPPGYEFVPLRGQTTGARLGLSSPARGDIDPVRLGYGMLRVDRYLPRDGTLTAESDGARRQTGARCQAAA